MLTAKTGNGDFDGRAVRQQRGQDNAGSAAAMLSVPTLWTVYVINFLALGLIWAYVMRSYPKLEAARFWTASAFAAAAGAMLAMVRMVFDSLLPLFAGGILMIFAVCLAAMGIRRFYGRPVSWRGTALITGLTFAGLLFFIFGYDNVSLRIAGLFVRPVVAAGADAEAVVLATGRPRQSRRPARRLRRHSHRRHLCRAGQRRICSAADSPSPVRGRRSRCWSWR